MSTAPATVVPMVDFRDLTWRARWHLMQAATHHAQADAHEAEARRLERLAALYRPAAGQRRHRWLKPQLETAA